MAEKEQMEVLAALMGDRGQETMQMLQRMERLKRLMGSRKPAEKPVGKGESGSPFENKNEKMITAAIPFLDQEYQKELYIIVRLMEMRRVLNGGLLEMREKTTEAPEIRRRKLLGAIQPYLPAEEQTQLQNFIRIMDMKAIMEQGDRK